MCSLVGLYAPRDSAQAKQNKTPHCQKHAQQEHSCKCCCAEGINPGMLWKRLVYFLPLLLYSIIRSFEGLPRSNPGSFEGFLAARLSPRESH